MFVRTRVILLYMVTLYTYSGGRAYDQDLLMHLFRVRVVFRQFIKFRVDRRCMRYIDM